MKKFKELKDKQKVLAVFGILGLVLILTGVTYAFFSYSKSGSTENTLKSGSITFWYDEQNREGNGISIEDALPISDADGKLQTKAFNFKIQSTTSSTTTIPYEITLRQKQGTDNIGNIVKVYLAKTSSIDATVASEEEVELSLFSSLSNETKNGYSEKLLHTDIVPASDSPYTQNYRLKMWVDNNTNFAANENGEYPYNNKTFSVMVNVYANGHVLDANSSTATVNSVSVGGTELTEKSTNYYEATLPEGTTSTTINVETGDYDRVTITKTESDYTTPVANYNNITRLSNTVAKTVNLTDGANYFKIVATSEDTTGSKEIHVMIKVKRIVVLQGLAKNIYDDNLEIQARIYDNPTLSTTSKNSNDPNGLYVSNATNEELSTYYFRGNVSNNYVNFAGKTWRIIRINEDGTVRLMLQDRLSTYTVDSFYYSDGTIKGSLENWYNQNIANNSNYSSKIADKAGNYFCEEARVGGSGDDINRAAANMRLVGNYTPTFTCHMDIKNHQYVDTNIGLITYDEAVYAGAYNRCNNDSYYLYDGGGLWIWNITMSPSGIGSDNIARNWYMVTNNATWHNAYLIGTAWNSGQKTSGVVHPVINLKADTTATKQVIDGKTYYVID